MKKFTYVSNYYDIYENCYFTTGSYENGNLALEIFNDQVGPISRVTVNPGFKIDGPYIAVKNYGENEGMVDFLKSINIIAPDPVKTVCSGFVTIPIYRLTDEGEALFK